MSSESSAGMDAAPGDGVAGFRASETERRLLGLVHRSGSITQAEVTRLMKVGQPAVSRLVGSLAATGLLKVGPARPHGRGQPSASLSLVGEFAYGLGVALLGDSLTLSLIDLAGAVLWSDTRTMPVMGRNEVCFELREMKRSMLKQTGVDAGRIVAAGVGVSAFFIGEGARMNPPPLLDDWALIDIGPILSDALKLPVIVDNDGNAACVGESLLGVGRRYRSFAYFQITNGFGGGLVLDGLPYRGSHRNAGEFAAVWQAMGIVHPNLERLRALFGESGQAYASVSAMLADFDIEARAVAVWLDEAVPAFSLAATAVSAVVDCEAVVLGGRLPRALADRLLARMVIAGTERRDRPRPIPQIVVSETPGDPVSLGAAALALQGHFLI